MARRRRQGGRTGARIDQRAGRRENEQRERTIEGYRRPIYIEGGQEFPDWFDKAVADRGWLRNLYDRVINRFTVKEKSAVLDILAQEQPGLLDEALQLVCNDEKLVDFSKADFYDQVYRELRELLDDLYEDEWKNRSKTNIQNVRTLAGQQQAKTASYNSILQKNQPDPELNEQAQAAVGFNQYQDQQDKARLAKNQKRVGRALKLATAFGVRGGNVKRFRVFASTVRFWMLGPFWLWLFVQFPIAGIGLVGGGGEVYLSNIPVAGELISYFTQGELILGFGMLTSIIIGWLTMLGALVYYFSKGINPLATAEQFGMFVLSLAFYVSPLTNLFPCAMLWMLFVIIEAGE